MAKPGREPKMDALKSAIVKLVAEVMPSSFDTISPPQAFDLCVKAANAAIELAARHFEEHYHCSECNPKEDFAAELRALNGNAQGGAE